MSAYRFAATVVIMIMRFAERVVMVVHLPRGLAVPMGESLVHHAMQRAKRPKRSQDNRAAGSFGHAYGNIGR